MNRELGVESTQKLILFKERKVPSRKWCNEKVYIFANAIKNIFSNFIPHEAIPFDDRDPPWINNKIKKETNEKNFDD